MFYALKVSLFTLLLLGALALQASPQVQNLIATQRTDTTMMVDIYFNIIHDRAVTVSIYASQDNGVNWNLPITLVSGDVGSNINPGNGKHIIWDVLAEHPNIIYETVKFKVIANDNEPCYTLYNGLIAYWNFNENAGSIIHDNTGNSFNFDTMNGTFSSEYSWSGGLIGSSIRRKASGNMLRYIYSSNFTNSVLPKQNFTYNVWIRGGMETITHYIYIYLWSSLYSVYFRVAPPAEATDQYGAISAYAWASTNTNDYAFTVSSDDLLIMDDCWHMITLTRIKSSNNEDIKIYYDGNEVSNYLIQSNWNKEVINRAGHLTLGGGNQGSQQLFLNGCYDMAGIWDRALLSNEIEQLFNAGYGREYPF